MSFPRLRHLRYGRHSRIRRWADLLAFLSGRATDLEDTGAAKAFTVNAAAVAATGVLTFTQNAGEGETVTIGTKVYTFQGTLTDVDGNVHIGASASASLDNLIAAINLSGGTPGTDYATSMTEHPDVGAAAGAGDTMDVTADDAGVAGNSIATTTDVIGGSFGDVNLTGGKNDNTLEITAHGYAVGDGPFLASSDDTLPAGLAASRMYWVREVVNANTIVLSTKRRNGPEVDVTDAGTGNHTLTKDDSAEAIHHYMKKNHPAVVNAAVDVDTL